MFRKLFYLVPCVVLLSISIPAKADLVITNGDFEVGAGPSTPDVNDWYDNSTANFWEDAWQSNDSWITPNGSQVVVFCSWDTVEGDPLAGSYLYQSIGISAGESSVTIGFDWGCPDDVAEGRHDALTVSVLASDGSFVADDANDVLGAAGVTLLDSASYDYVALGTDGEIFPVVVTLDLSGANVGDEIFLRFNNYMPEAGADPWPVLDNVHIQVAGVDDPSDMADSSGDIKRIEAWVDEGNLNLTMTVYGVFSPSVEDTPAGMSNRYYYHWILDTDNNPDTGYFNDEYEGNPTNLETPIGVDVLVQFGWSNGDTDGVYAYTLDPLTGDEVELFEEYEYTIDGDTIHAVIPLEDLGLEPGQTIAVSGFQEGASNDWQVDWVESFELTLTATEGYVFFSDDFESYTDDAGVTAAGWSILDTPTATEDSTWTITNPGGRVNPPTLDGSPSVGNFMISDSDTQSISGDQDNGASHDLYTPSFSTLGYETVWLHVDVSAQLNNNGTAIFDVEVSTDDGETWTNVFSRVAPGRGTSEPATTRLPDNTNADGYYGRLDVDLSAVAADQADVKVRFRHYEPDWDWWIAIDNVLIDNVAAPQGGPVTVFSEDFSNGLGQMNVVSGQGNTGTETWSTSDKGGRYIPGTVQEHGVNRLGPHPNEHPEFAIIDSDADPDPAEDEWLMTPPLDLSGFVEVFLHYDSETVMSGVSNQEVLVSLDGGSTFETTPIFAYTGGGLFDGGEEPVFANRIFDVSSIAAGKNQVVFAFRYTGDGDDWWWAIDNVKVSGVAKAEDSSLVIYYSFDEVGAVVADQSGKGHDGVVVGDVTAEANGMYGGAANLANTGYLDLDGANFPAEDIPTSGFTLAAWTNIDGTSNQNAIFNARASDSTWLIHPEIRPGDGDYRFTVRKYGGVTIGNINGGTPGYKKPEGTPVPNEWVHVAMTFSRADAQVILYVNGEVIAQAPISEDADMAGDWGLGARVGYNIDDARHFTGLMDEFHMFTRALSQDEILDVMAGM